MIKKLLVFVFFISIINVVLAKSDTTLYYMKNLPGINASTYAEDAVPAKSKDDATFIRAVIAPSLKGDTLYTVKDYYLSGKIKFTGQSSLLAKSNPPGFSIKLQGTSVAFFENGHKKRICTFVNNNIKGDILEYFPNGKINTIKTIPDVDMAEYRQLLKGITTEQQIDAYNRLIDSVTRPILKQCQDSIGVVLAEEGNGKWVEYQGDYKIPFAEGNVKQGFAEGEWHGQLCDTVKYTSTYKKGMLIEGKSVSKTNVVYPFNKITTLPEFPGGVNQLGKYLGRMIRYPADAREREVQGKVLLQFIVNTDGTLSDIQVIRKVYPSVDAEAFKVFVQSPGWIPGTRFGINVMTKYTIPVSFTIVHDN